MEFHIADTMLKHVPDTETDDRSEPPSLDNEEFVLNLNTRIEGSNVAEGVRA